MAGACDVGFACAGVHGLAREFFGQPICDLDSMRERTLVVREPVEHALPDDGDDDLDHVIVAQVRAQGGPELLDRAHDQHVAATGAAVLHVTRAHGA